MKVLAVDYGEKKTGLAISDELGVVTTKLPVLFADKQALRLDGLKQIVIEFDPDIILFGVPLLNSHSDNPQVIRIKEFAELLKIELEKDATSLTSIPKFVFWDESFSSQRAEEGRTRAYVNKKADSDAARLFLQEFLDSPDGLKLYK